MAMITVGNPDDQEPLNQRISSSLSRAAIGVPMAI